jgi:hypothetical protein
MVFVCLGCLFGSKIVGSEEIEEGRERDGREASTDAIKKAQEKSKDGGALSGVLPLRVERGGNHSILARLR